MSEQKSNDNQKPDEPKKEEMSETAKMIFDMGFAMMKLTAEGGAK